MIYSSFSIVKLIIEENPYAYEYTNEEQKIYIENNKSDIENGKINTINSTYRKNTQKEPKALKEFLKVIVYHKK